MDVYLLVLEHSICDQIYTVLYKLCSLYTKASRPSHCWYDELCYTRPLHRRSSHRSSPMETVAPGLRKPCGAERPSGCMYKGYEIKMNLCARQEVGEYVNFILGIRENRCESLDGAVWLQVMLRTELAG